MTELDLTKLREIAEAATPGPWEAELATKRKCYAPHCGFDHWYNLVHIEGVTLLKDTVLAAEDAIHIAAFDPPTVIALIDEIERLKARIEAAKAIHFDEGKSQGYFNNEPYGERDHYCSECGSFGEYGVEWPCPTVKALAGGSDE